MRRLVIFSALAALLAGCAGYTIQQVPPELSGGPPGYDVYTPEPYLQGVPSVVDAGSSKKALVMTYNVVWLPNYAKRYRVRSWSGLGKANFVFTFTDGWKLTALTDQGDNSNVLAAIVDLTKHLLPAGILASGKVNENGTFVEGSMETAWADPVLFKIEFDDCGHVTCLRPSTSGRPPARTRRSRCTDAGSREEEGGPVPGAEFALRAQ